MHSTDGAISLEWADPITGEPCEETVTLPATIGRAADNTVVLTSEMISRHHATLARENGQIVLTDSSANGTFVNGERQQRAALTGGDSVQIGPYILSVRERILTAPDVTLAWTDSATGQPMRRTVRLPLIIGRGSASGIALNDTQVSRAHATLTAEDGAVVVTDSSSNGTFVNGTRQERATLQHGDQLRIGGTTFTLSLAAAPVRSTALRSDQEAVIGMDDATMIDGATPSGGAATLAPARPAPFAPPGTSAPPDAASETFVPTRGRDDQTVLGASAPRPAARSFPPPIFNEQFVSVAALGQTGLPVYTTTYALLGGGWGSFIFADNLVIHGVDPGAIISLGIYPEPFKRYQTLARNSQIPPHERLRSNSESTPDNIWGTPGYAAREAWRSFWTGHWGNAIQVLWQVLGEPSAAQTFTPIAGEVFASATREAKRIGWDKIWRFGRIRAIRKTDDGRYAIAYSQSDDQQHSHAILLANYIHLATGYPALQFLPDLQEYRERTGDFEHVINGYEAHDYVYQRLEQNGGVILLRGRGIVASRLIQRISEARAKNPNIAILHLMRTPITKGHTWHGATRPVIHHVEIQPFNWPKGCWGGEQRTYIEKADEETRLSLMADWGGTTTAQRGDWVRLIKRGMKEGWYKIEFGDVVGVDRTQDGRIATRIRAKGPLGGTTELIADYIVDATGLDAKANRNPLLQDTVNHYDLYVNKLGRIQVRNDMEIAGMQNGPGRFFAVGAMTLGGPLAGADTFLGLQAAAAVIVEHLIKARSPGLRRLGPFRSLYQWTKWVRRVAP